MTFTHLFIGIDPGASGAIAVLDEEQKPLICQDFSRMDCAVTLKFAASAGVPVTTFIEHVHAMPQNGSVSMFHFGENFGWWQGVLDALGLPFKLVDPKRWQNHFGLVKKNPTDKPSLELCRKAFPTVDLHLKKHNGRSDALCIASYALDWFRSGEKL